jgi:hypothetical protein
MIRYALDCADGHKFESWFPDSDAYDKQRKRGLVACPECGSAKVEKSVMAPAVLGGDRDVSARPPEARSVELLMDDHRRKAREMIARVKREIEANTDDVGGRFPEVARAIHQGDEPERAIRGRATLAEAKALVEDGVGVLPMPTLGDELN